MTTPEKQFAVAVWTDHSLYGLVDPDVNLLRWLERQGFAHFDGFDENPERFVARGADGRFCLIKTTTLEVEH